MTFPFQPVVIIGAGRSGTNILRDTLTALPGAGTWPCDEINYIWRHGNALHPDDELGPEHARPPVRRFIRRAFRRLARKQGLDCVIEKTCANSLRVGFVAAVLPEARFIFLVRDGRDVVSSAIQRWRAPLDIPYLMKKARYVPPSDLPYYGLRYLWNRLKKVASRDRRLAFWGPRFADMEESLRTESLHVVCARQWRACIDKSEEELALLPEERVHRLRYEDFVNAPEEEVGRLAELLGIEAPAEQVRAACRRIRTGRIGAWRDSLGEQELADMRQILNPALVRLGYEPS